MSANQNLYQKNYYLKNKDTILPRIREQQKLKYDKDLKFKLLKRYQSRVNNFFDTPTMKAENLLKCTPAFFVKWILWCLKDMKKSRIPWEQLDLGHVRPVSTFDKNDLSGWCWINVCVMTQEENLKQGNNRYLEKERKQANRVIRFLKTNNVDIEEVAGSGLDIQNLLSKLPFSTTGIPGELHYFWPGGNANFCGPGTSLDGKDGRRARLNPDDTPKDWSKPINQVDAECYRHDIDYRNSKNNLPMKHAADRKLLAALEKIKPADFNEAIMKKVVQILIGLKLKLGLGISDSSNLSDFTTAEILGLGITKVPTVPKEYASIVSKELHTPARKHYPRRRIYYNYLDHIWAMDLMEVPKLLIKSRNEKHYKYCLVVIDMWSKYLWLIALENKTGTTVKNALKSLFEQSGRKPLKIHSDRGGEFWNKEVLDYFKKYGIHLYSTESENKSSIVERVIRTIRSRIEPILTEKELSGEKASWVDTIPEVLKWYNNEHKHRTTKLTPTDASKEENQDMLSKRYRELRAVKLPDGKPLEVGQYVRLYKWKNKFAKESKKNWTDEIFRIKTVLDTNPKTYVIEDESGEEIKGAVYREELLPSAFSF